MNRFKVFFGVAVAVATLTPSTELHAQCPAPVYAQGAAPLKANTHYRISFDPLGTQIGSSNNPAIAFDLTSSTRQAAVLAGFGAWSNTPGTGITISDSGSNANPIIVTTAWPTATVTYPTTDGTKTLTLTDSGAGTRASFWALPDWVGGYSQPYSVAGVVMINTNAIISSGNYWNAGLSSFLNGLTLMGYHEGGHFFGLGDRFTCGSALSVMPVGGTQNDAGGCKVAPTNCERKDIQRPPYARSCNAPTAVEPRLGDQGCSCNTSANRWECACLLENTPTCSPGENPICSNSEWVCEGAVACDPGNGGCGGCTDEICGGGSNPPPGPNNCSQSLEVYQYVTAQNCYSVCPIDSAPQLYNDEQLPCTGRWLSELCYAVSGGQICPTLFQPVYVDGGEGQHAIMYANSAVRDCSGYSYENPVYKRTAQECLSHCASNSADACEWYINGDCYVEHGSNCSVEYGYFGWSAYVLDEVGNPGGGSSGNMSEHSAVRGCSNYSELSPVYQATAEACSSYCQGENADACEWASGNGDCYAEFGDGCYVEPGHGGWWAAVYSSPESAGASTFAWLSLLLSSEGLSFGLLAAVLLTSLLLCLAIVAAGRRVAIPGAAVA